MYNVTVTDVNEAPTLSAKAIGGTFTKGNAPVSLFSDVSANAVDNAQTFTGLTSPSPMLPLVTSSF